MGSSFLFSPAKRSIDAASGMLEPSLNIAIANGGTSSKRSKPPPPPLPVPSGHVAFRFLCRTSHVGGVIGKSGSVIKQLQQDTSSKIRVEVPPPGSDDYRVILVIASASVNKRITLTDAQEIDVSPAQEAVIRVFERIIEVAAESDGTTVEDGGLITVRLLAEVSQAGSVIGKGGKVVEKIRKDTGCKIKVLRSEKLPSCASPSDEMVEIEGNILGVKKALVAVCRCIQDCPPADKLRMSGNRHIKAVPEDNLSDLCNVRTDLPPQPSSILQTTSTNYASSGRSLSLEAERVPSIDLRMPQQEVVFRLLCSNDRVGGVIGKGGMIIKALQSETGASITIGASVAECDERLITVTAKESPDLQYSPAQKATILVFNRSVEAGMEKRLDLGVKGSISARLVVPSSQVGCLLGKGGSIISEMRKVTGAGIWIIGGDQIAKCTSDSDQVVQITGEFVNVQDALYNVTGKLRDNIMPSKMSTGVGTRSSSSMITEISPYARERDSSSFGSNSVLDVSHSLSRHTILSQSMDHLGFSHKLDHPVSPRLYKSQTVAGANARNVLDVDRGLATANVGMERGSGNRSAIVTNTTVEIAIPENVIGCVYGENGGNLARLRQISGAKVTLREPRLGTSDRIIVISGTPDETQAAQSLLHAFILTGPS